MVYKVLSKIAANIFLFRQGVKENIYQSQYDKYLDEAGKFFFPLIQIDLTP